MKLLLVYRPRTWLPTERLDHRLLTMCYTLTLSPYRDKPASYLARLHLLLPSLLLNHKTCEQERLSCRLNEQTGIYITYISYQATLTCDWNQCGGSSNGCNLTQPKIQQVV